MSDLSYNGIALDIIHTRQISCEAVLSRDRTTYLYTRWIFDIDFVVNPAATSYLQRNVNFLGFNLNPPVRQAGQLPAVTHAAIRDRLAQPQKQLVFKIGNNTLLSTPLPGRKTDAANGPLVENLVVHQVIGTRTILGSARFIAHVNEAPASGGKFPILLSHRWRKAQTTDRNHYSVIVTQGEATFRVDELLSRGTIPDQYRPQLFHQIPLGCRRTGVRVYPSEDGATLWYETEDTEVPYNTGSRFNCTWIEAYQRNWYEAPSIFQATNNAINIGTSLAGSVADAVGHCRRGKPGMAAGSATVGVARAGISLLGVALDLIPSMHFMMEVKAWGNNSSTRQNLTNLVTGIIASRIGFNGFLTGASTIVLAQDIAGKYAECAATHSVKFVNGTDLGFGFGQNQDGNVAILNSFNGPRMGERDIADLLARGTTFGVNQVTQLPRSSGTRGSLALSLMSQGLSNPGSLPPSPPFALFFNDATL